jgi:hypothetical protein
MPTQRQRVKVWEASLAKLSEVAIAAGLPPKGKRGSLIEARRFAESLILCPLYDAAAACMRSDPQAAASFIDVSFGVFEEVKNPDNNFGELAPHHTTPFFDVCSDTIFFLDSLETEFPDHFA